MYRIKLDIKEPKTLLCGPEYTHRIESMLEFTYARAQIKQNKLEGFYIIFNGQKIEIDSNGRLSEWPEGLYDQNDKLLDILIGD